ncbi:hypothetical protein [Hymenobacter weizhouensis]|uniref:hypothetical protein n=1 Tax=Hymenobacter sp. YIM 151500-1 TaxID=2987689 RepID=UPI0022276A19|nr:hypothetical protein [Hymenobacter sp. YIM 151500-1]UYZ61768.1 hypothetical protein OIS53_12225 [Hymenobacter sp. YIM 151500-1]
MADQHRPGTLGHYVPYLLGRHLRAGAWPPEIGKRAILVLLGLLAVVYGLGFGHMLGNHDLSATLRANFLLGLYGTVFTSTLLVDFVPSYRPVQRLLPDHFPVSGRRSAELAFLLDLISLRRLLLGVFLAALACVPGQQRVALLGVALLLGATALSFGLRWLLTWGRGRRHPLVAAYAAVLALAGAWLTLAATKSLTGPLAAGLPWLVALLPLGLLAGQVAGLGPQFLNRNLVRPALDTAESQWLARLSPEWKAYLRKTWPALSMGLAFKVFLLVASSVMQAKHGSDSSRSIFYLVFLPVISFTYANNNLYGYLYSLTLNELQRLGLTSRLLVLYLRLAVPVLLLDCLLSAVLLVALFPASTWPLLGLLPLSAGVFLALGLWGSLSKAKPVYKNLDLMNMRNNASTLMNILTLATAATLYFMPWWWVRAGLAVSIMLTAVVPVRRLLSNHGPQRRQLHHRLQSM